MTSLREFELFVRTVAQLRPEQVAHRIRQRAVRRVISAAPALFHRRWRGSLRTRPRWPGDLDVIDRLDESLAFPSPEDNSKGIFEFIGERRELGRPIDWQPNHASQLWRYNLNYFEWAWAFERHPDREWARTEFQDLWLMWRESTQLGRGDAWSPYVASLRSWVLCNVFGALVAGSSLESVIVDDLTRHARFLSLTVERDVGGNHLVKNLKALIALGHALDEQHTVDRGVRLLERELKIQVLEDGGHFERSPSYHCQVLADFIDIRAVLSARAFTLLELDAAIDRMQRWLGTVLLPDGDVPLLNDSWRVGSERIRLLGPIRPPDEPISVLANSGIVVMRDGHGMHLVADVGLPCPKELPAHAHADCLTFEMCMDSERVIVDTGTSTYERGQRRKWERSTLAHNTVAIDREDQTAVWGTFRATRLARPTIEGVSAQEGAVSLAASHDGYRRLPGSPTHRRTWTLTAGSLTIVDEIVGAQKHEVQSSLFLRAPARRDGSRVIADSIVIELDGDFSLERADVADRFGGCDAAVCIRRRDDVRLPVRLVTRISRGTDRETN